MARPNRLREKIAAGKTCVGPLFQEFWSPELFEFCAMAGFDFVIADGEHAGVDPQGVRNLARAAQGAGATALARVPNGEPSLWIITFRPLRTSCSRSNGGTAKRGSALKSFTTTGSVLESV